MPIKSKLMIAVLTALALGTSSAFARNGADDGIDAPECDDHGTDIVCNIVLAKNGADDLVDGFDDGGVDGDDGFDDNGVDVLVG